ncbi:hypothetical protein [Mesoterricola silvestris]|uniref:Uncharacterized protein n=1 Tax=Mesoterricola silvestris TaxID=2927979 RepID=A0AA48GKW4_9BACT|nr:hypothetical protein [Mesoterricola silvestris]BDU73242.1 hypothetical protein METEAL_24160 [Mesoterricola silvestris]
MPDEASPLDASGRETPAPAGPWSFLGAALAGGGGRWGLGLLGGWLCFHVLTSTLWAMHLKALAGWSGLPSYWGELITVRDLWDLAVNGGLKDHWTGPFAPLAALGALAWFLWAGWKVQARAAGVPAGFAAWLWGFADALVLAALPLALVGTALFWTLRTLAETGIQGLGWLDWVGGVLLRLSFVSVFFVQAWLCRLDRAGAPGWNLGSSRALGRHLRSSFLRLWTHPVQWTVLVVGGVAVRAGLPFLVLLLGWRLGGGTPLRVWTLLGFQALAVLANAWLIGWFLRVTALFWRNDSEVEAVIMELEAQASGK